jgi:hypothetical protein
MSDAQWIEADNDKSQRIYNTQLHLYTRINPETNEQAPRITWTRRVTPYMELDTGWIPIQRKVYTNEELLESVEHVPSLLPSSDEF